MLVLFESANGYCLFKLLDDSKLKETDNLWKEFVESPEKISELFKLVSFKSFKDTAEALKAATTLLEGKIGKPLKKFLQKNVAEKTKEKLLVADAKLGNLIKEELEIGCVASSGVQELMRCIRAQLDALVGEFPRKEMAAMTLGLAHSLSRYKLKFSPDKIDTMIVQAVSLLDDLDKELNNYIMRCREWYGWHFPELGKLIQDHQCFARVVLAVGFRHKMKSADLSELLDEDMERQVKEAAEISMGTQVSDFDIDNISQLCAQILEIHSYRAELYDYLKNRMMALAPNLTVLLGELVGARLISHAGSLINLAKYPASTVQILGAEKALFRALKTKKDTPKYGLLYHAQLVSQAPTHLKGKMSRMLAAKSALACRVDALGEDNVQDLGVEHRAYLETRLKALQQKPQKRISGTGKGKANFESYKFKSEIVPYDASADSTIPKGAGSKRKFEDNEETEPEKEPEKKKKKVKKEPVEEEATAEDAEVSSSTKKKKKKKTAEESEAMGEESQEAAASSKKKKKLVEEPAVNGEEPAAEDAPSSGKKKKKKGKKENV